MTAPEINPYREGMILGEHNIELAGANNDRMVGFFTGRGFVDFHDEGSELANISMDTIYSKKAFEGDRKTLQIQDLFPSEWQDMEQEFEYTISVFAKKLPPQK